MTSSCSKLQLPVTTKIISYSYRKVTLEAGGTEALTTKATAIKIKCSIKEISNKIGNQLCKHRAKKGINGNKGWEIAHPPSSPPPLPPNITYIFALLQHNMECAAK